MQSVVRTCIIQPPPPIYYSSFHQPLKEIYYHLPSSCPASPRPCTSSSAMICLFWAFRLSGIIQRVVFGGLASSTWPVSQVHPCCSTCLITSPLFCLNTTALPGRHHFIILQLWVLEGFYLFFYEWLPCEHLGTKTSLYKYPFSVLWKPFLILMS